MNQDIQTAPMEKWANIVRTVELHPSQVPEHIRNGWIILLVYARRVDVADQRAAENGCILYTTRSEYEPVVLVGQTNIDALTGDLASAKSQIEHLEKRVMEMQALTKQRDNLLETEKLLRATNDQHNETIKISCAESSRLRTANMKLEADISKLRRALGDLRMKDILEGKP